MEQKTVKGVMKAALKASGIKQMELAEKLGVSQASISGNMNRPRVGSDVLVTMLNTMGYTVVAGKKTDTGFEPMWEIMTDSDK